MFDLPENPSVDWPMITNCHLQVKRATENVKKLKFSASGREDVDVLCWKIVGELTIFK